jgi:hypothetical protein
MPLVNIDSASVASILAQLASEPTQGLEADYAILQVRFPTLPWRDILSAMGGVAGSLAPASDGARAALAPQFTDVGAVSNPAIYDVTSAVATAQDTGILDVTPWRYLNILYIAGAAGNLNGFPVDDTGANILVGTQGALFAQFVGTFLLCGIGPGCIAPAGQAGGTLQFPLPRRVRFNAAAIVGQTTRLRIEGRR